MKLTAAHQDVLSPHKAVESGGYRRACHGIYQAGLCHPSSKKLSARHAWQLKGARFIPRRVFSWFNNARPNRLPH
jgi:hypothetical protein